MSNDSGQPPEEERRRARKGLPSGSEGTLRAYLGKLEAVSQEEDLAAEATQLKRTRRPQPGQEQFEERGGVSERRRRDLAKDGREQLPNELYGQERRPVRGVGQQEEQRARGTRRPGQEDRRENVSGNVQGGRDGSPIPSREQRNVQGGTPQRQVDRPGGRIEEQRRQSLSAEASLREQRNPQMKASPGQVQRSGGGPRASDERQGGQRVQSGSLKEKRNVPSQDRVVGEEPRVQGERRRGQTPPPESLKESQRFPDMRQGRSDRNPGPPDVRSVSPARASSRRPGQQNTVSAHDAENNSPPLTAAQRLVKQIQAASSARSTAPASSAAMQESAGYRTQHFMRRVRQLSGKMAALASNYKVTHSMPPAAPIPQVPISSVWTYAPPEIVSVDPSSQKQPWRRSRAQRVAYQMRQRRHRLRYQRVGAVRLWILGSLALLLLLLFGTFGASAYSYNYYQQQVPIVANLAQLKMPQDTRIYDRNGTLLYEAYDHNANDLNAGRRIAVSYSQIPLVMQDAIIAAEDNTFWTNDGVNPAAIIRAASSGYGGGSTITQQVIKNLTHNTSYTITRKITEAAMALALTQQYPKWKILEMYFNIAPFGAYDNGVETAAEGLFNLKRTCDTKTYQCTAGISQIAKDSNGKSDPLLGLARASLLASIPNNPSEEDPRVDNINLQRVLERQDYVLNQMMDQNMTVDGTKTGAPITPAVIKQVEAMTAKMKFTSYDSVKQAPYFVDWVMYQVARALDPEDLANGYALFQTSGLNIYTTIDAKLEKYVETSIHDNLDTQEYQLFPAADAGYKIISQALNVNDAAAVVMDAKTGEILAMDGGADYNSPDVSVGGEYNTAAPPDDGNGYDPTASTYDSANAPTIGRQPGSTMKPIIYAAAFENGWYPNMVLPDQMTFFPNGAPAGTAIPTGSALKRMQNSDGTYYYPNVSSAASAVKLYAPTDYGQTYHNYTSGKQATISYGVSNSFNITALRAMSFVGPQNVLNMAQRLGIDTLHTTDGGINNIAWALGTNNIPVIQMVGAYQVFANNGSRIPPQGILDIYDNYGHDLFHFDPSHPPSSQVISPQVAFMITSMLRDQPDRYLEFGYDPDLSFSDFDQSCLYVVDCNYQMAAKTGTSSSFVDNWTLGYTPDVVVGVWAGNANGEAMANNTVGITGAAPIFSDIMENVSGFCPTRHVANDCPKYNFEFSSNPTRQFTAPDGLVESDVSGVNGLQGTGSGYTAYMLPNEMPTQTGITTTTDNNNNNNNNNNFGISNNIINSILGGNTGG